MPSPFLPLLITGLPGIPGYNSFHYFRKKYGDDVIGVKPSHTVELGYPGVYGISAEDISSLEGLFKKYQFKTVIDASGLCALKSCEHNPALADLVNIQQGKTICELAKTYGAQLLRFSSDLVFDGAGQGNYAEDDAHTPITVYGKTMSRSEDVILNTYAEVAIFRIPLPMGPSLNGHAGAVDWIENRFKKDNLATLYFDEVRSNLYVQDILKVLEYFMEHFVPGVFHLGGPLPLTLFQIGQIVNRLGNFKPELLLGSPRSEDASVVPRVGDVSMDISKIQKILPPDTIKPWPFHPEHVPNGPEWHQNRTKPYPAGSLHTQLYGYSEGENSRNPLNWHKKADFLK